MIADWRGALELAWSLMAPAGQLWIIDFGGQERLPASFRPLLRRWLALFHVVPREELESALRNLVAGRNAQLAIERPYRGYAQCATVRGGSA